MLGVIANSLAIIVGAILGLLFKRLISKELAERIEQALGYCTLLIGIKMALKFENVLVLILCVAVGGLIGTKLKIENTIEQLAKKLQKSNKLLREGSFAQGFSSASILFCTGAMAVIGSIQSGTSGNHEVLFAKAALDGIISISFAAIYGLGVAFSALPVFLYQGVIAVFSSKLEILSHTRVINEISGVGGILLMMIGVKLAHIKSIAVGDFLPAIPLVIFVTAILIGYAF